MAEEPAPENPEAAPPPKAPSPWLPLIAVLILMPAISYATTQFLILPKIRGAVGEQAKPAHAAAGHHGKGEKDKHGKEAEAGGKFSYDFENIVVNLSGAMGSRYLKTTFTAFSANPDLKAAIDENKKQLLDVAITVLGSRTMADLETAGAKNVVRNDLMANFNQALKSELIEQIYFSEFVVQ